MTFANDIALVELSGAATLNNFVYPICLPYGEEPNITDICYVTGFGATGGLLWKLNFSFRFDITCATY